MALKRRRDSIDHHGENPTLLTLCVRVRVFGHVKIHSNRVKKKNKKISKKVFRKDKLVFDKERKCPCIGVVLFYLTRVIGTNSLTHGPVWRRSLVWNRLVEEDLVEV